MENIISVKESNLVFRVYPKIRYYYRILHNGFYLENGREEKDDKSNKNFQLINPLPSKANGEINLSFQFFNEYRFDSEKSKIKLEDGAEYSFGRNDSQHLNFSSTYYFNSEIILIKDLEPSEKKSIMGYYREYIPSYNVGTFEAIDCVIKAQGKFFIPVSPKFIVINPMGKLNAVKDGKIIEIENDVEVPINKQYGFRVYCC